MLECLAEPVVNTIYIQHSLPINNTYIQEVVLSLCRISQQARLTAKAFHGHLLDCIAQSPADNFQMYQIETRHKSTR